MNETDVGNPNLVVEAVNEQSRPIDLSALARAARSVLHEEGVAAAEISLAVVDDPTIHDLNRRYLQHDYATDVLSFLLDEQQGRLEGEVIVSADTAAAAAEQYGWSLNDELLLYVVHGALHLVGYDDLDPDSKAEMRRRERLHLARFGLTPRYAEDDQSGGGPVGSGPGGSGPVGSGPVGVGP
ncbi:MAG: rRNA maturation RNase YbeY [Pirellulaceae bacterium]